MKLNFKFNVLCVTLCFCGYTGVSKFQSENQSIDSMLMDNIEALTNTTEDDIINHHECLRKNGVWNKKSESTGNGYETVTCTIAGQLTVYGRTFYGDFEVGSVHNIKWESFTCVDDWGKCCTKQGVYTGDFKLA